MSGRAIQIAVRGVSISRGWKKIKVAALRLHLCLSGCNIDFDPRRRPTSLAAYGLGYARCAFKKLDVFFHKYFLLCVITTTIYHIAVETLPTPPPPLLFLPPRLIGHLKHNI